MYKVSKKKKKTIIILSIVCTSVFIRIAGMCPLCNIGGGGGGGGGPPCAVPPVKKNIISFA